jgi:hypothetical protein
VWPLGIIKPEVFFQTPVKLNAIIKHMNIDAFIFDALPQPLDEDVIDCPAFTVHADGNRFIPVFQQGGVLIPGELASLIRVDDLWLTMGLDGLFNDLTNPE